MGLKGVGGGARTQACFPFLQLLPVTPELPGRERYASLSQLDGEW